MNPPDTLEKNQAIVRVIKAEGNNLYNCELPNKKDLVLELAQRFRNTIWIKRGGYVLAERYDEADGRVMGEIINVVRDEKAWRKQPYWYVDPFFRHTPWPLLTRPGRKSLPRPGTRTKKTRAIPTSARCRHPTPKTSIDLQTT